MSSKILFSLNILLLVLIPHSLAYPSFRIAPNVTIEQIPENYHSSLAAVNGVHSCGGHGQLLKFRYSPCSNVSISTGLCQLEGDGHVRKSELEFIPSKTVQSLGLQFVVITDYQITTSYARIIPQSGVTADNGGHPYLSTAYFGANENVKGTKSKFQYIIYREEDDNVEVCAEFDVEII